MGTVGSDTKDVQYIPVSTKGRCRDFSATDRYGDPPCRSSARGKEEKNRSQYSCKPLGTAAKWLYAAYIARIKRLAATASSTWTSWAALIKANRFIYNNRRRPSRSQPIHQQPADVVNETYDILANAGAWPVNDGLPKDMVEWTINKQVELGTIKAEEKPSYEKLIDVSVIQAALGKAGGRLTVINAGTK